MSSKYYATIVTLWVGAAGCLAPVGVGVSDAPDAQGALPEPDGGTPDYDAKVPDSGHPPEDAEPSSDEDAGYDGGVDMDDAGYDGGATPTCDFQAEMRHCGACHSAGIHAAGLDLLSEGVADRLIDVRSRSQCGSGKLVDLHDPAASVLYVRISSDDCGVSTIHRREESLQKCVLSWIEALAMEKAVNAYDL